MAHFLEHLVFKGGEKYDDYRKVNETAERMGAVLNAYTSHDLVAFHITCRAEVVARRDRPADRLRRPAEDRRRGARPRARRRDPGDRARERPAVGRRRAPDRPRGVRRPPARAGPVLGPGGAPAHVHARGDRRLPLAPVGRRARRRVPGRQHRARARGPRAGRVVRPLPVDLAGRLDRAGPGVHRRRRWSRAASPTSRTCGSPTARRSTRATRRSAPRSASTRRCSAARWARGCSTRSASSAAWRTRSTRSTTRSPTSRSCSSRPAWSPASASRPTRACARSSTSCAPTGRAEDEFERARAYAAGRRVLAFENTNAVAPHAASQSVVFGQDIDPDEAIAALDRTTFERGQRGRARHLGGGVGGLRRAARSERVHRLTAIPPHHPRAPSVSLWDGGETDRYC